MEGLDQLPTVSLLVSRFLVLEKLCSRQCIRSLFGHAVTDIPVPCEHCRQ